MNENLEQTVKIQVSADGGPPVCLKTMTIERGEDNLAQLAQGLRALADHLEMYELFGSES